MAEVRIFENKVYVDGYLVLEIGDEGDVTHHERITAPSGSTINVTFDGNARVNKLECHAPVTMQCNGSFSAGVIMSTGGGSFVQASTGAARSGSRNSAASAARGSPYSSVGINIGRQIHTGGTRRGRPASRSGNRGASVASVSDANGNVVSASNVDQMEREMALAERDFVQSLRRGEPALLNIGGLVQRALAGSRSNVVVSGTGNAVNISSTRERSG